MRSTQSVEQSGNNRDGAGGAPVSVASNLPDANLAATSPAGGMSSENRSEETVNYEISKTTQVGGKVKQSGNIKRISAAVLVDGTYATDANGAQTYTPASPGRGSSTRSRR